MSSSISSAVNPNKRTSPQGAFRDWSPFGLLQWVIITQNLRLFCSVKYLSLPLKKRKGLYNNNTNSRQKVQAKTGFIQPLQLPIANRMLHPPYSNTCLKIRDSWFCCSGVGLDSIVCSNLNSRNTLILLLMDFNIPILPIGRTVVFWLLKWCIQEA